MDRRIFKKLKKYLSDFIGIQEEKINKDTSIFDLGIDSVMMVAFLDKLNEQFHTHLKLSDVTFTYNSMEALCSYIQECGSVNEVTSASLEKHLVEEEPEEEFPENEDSGETQELKDLLEEACCDTNTSIIDVINMQGKIMQQVFIKQLELLSGKNLHKNADTKMKVQKAVEKKQMVRPDKKVHSEDRTAKQTDSLSVEQKQFIKELIQSLGEKTSASKDIAQRYRSCLADLDEIAGFKMLLKELHYQITIEHGEDAYLFDVNGNKFIDIAMGYGTLILGHSPQFVMDAIKAEVDKGMQLGARQRLVGEIAEKICKLTGFDRATFTVTGTEAVMTAMKIARAYTGKNKIAIFTNAYHGHNDATLVSKFRMDDRNSPIAPGIDANASNDVLIFKYNDVNDISRMLEQEGIAAALVEPVQSRFPECHPVEFLRELRRVTKENGILLIFDEIITGFRCNVGGAKKLFGIEPDLATYGKAVANGMPVGVVAGKKEIMDVVDGGQWQYGDGSYPVVEKTFFAGTFFKHPFSMAAMNVIMDFYNEHGAKMIEETGRKADYLREKLNTIFDENRIPIHIGNFTSLFMFKSTAKNSLDMDIFYYTLLDEGVYTWEGRTCFISNAHTDADVEEIIKAVDRTVKRMISAGFYRENENQPSFHKGVPDETYYE